MKIKTLLLAGAAGLLAAAPGVASASGGGDVVGPGRRTTVLYKGTKSPNDAAPPSPRPVGASSTTTAIGVTIARSSSGTFSTTLGNDSRRAGCRRHGRLRHPAGRGAVQRRVRASLPTLRWPTTTPSRACSGTWSRSTRPRPTPSRAAAHRSLVGDIDTGLDYTHPDLAANVDDAAQRELRERRRRCRARWPRTTTTVTAPTRPARSRRPRTASASSAWRRT